MLEHALDYARVGIRVLPIYSVANGFCSCGNPKCNSPGKHPLIPEWQINATTDEKDIKYWWGERVNANIGLATGRKSGIWVLDIDGREGKKSIKDLEIPPTLCWITGGGGIHVVFRWKEGIRNRVDILPSVDIRGDGGYVLAPPSMHVSGRPYKMLYNYPVNNAPDWLLEMMEEQKQGVTTFLPGKKFIIANGTRNNTLFHFGLQVRKEFPWLSETALQKMLETINEHHSEGPLSKRELKMIGKSVMRYTGGVDDK